MVARCHQAALLASSRYMFKIYRIRRVPMEEHIGLRLAEQLLASEVSVENILIAAIHRTRVLNGLVPLRIRCPTCVEHSRTDGALEQLGVFGAGQTGFQLLIGLDQRHTKLRGERSIK